MVKRTRIQTTLASAIPNACRKLLQIRPNSGNQKIKNKKSSSLLHSLVEYLTADSFMYGPLLTPPPPSPSIEPGVNKYNKNCDIPTSPVEEHGGASTLSSLHSPPSTPISRLRTMSTITRRILLGSNATIDEDNGHVRAPSSVEVQHKCREDALFSPSLKQKEKLFQKSEANGNYSQDEDDEVANEDGDDDESSKSFTESQNEYDVTPLQKEAATEVARRLIRKVGGRLSKELGIFVDARDSEVERWFLATTFLSHPSDFELSKQMFKKLQSMGISKMQDVLGVDQNELEEAFQNVMRNHRIASRLQKIALALHTKRGGGVCGFKWAIDYAELKRDLESLPGYSRNAARTFIREMRGVWQSANPEFEIRTRNAAKHLHLLSSIKDGAEATSSLLNLGQDAGVDVRDMELALVKLSFQHARYYRNCLGGCECEFARITLADVGHLIATL